LTLLLVPDFFFAGHRNQYTIKGVSFFGLDDEWVISGSDCGYIYFWSKETAEVVACLHGDSHVVNCLERHPHDYLTLATSGIDDDIKIWGCSAVERIDGISVKDRKRMERNIIERATMHPTVGTMYQAVF
jgi:WD40 repeat protein